MVRFYVYEIHCTTPRHVYVGQTIDFERRLSEHIRGKDAFTKEHLPESARVLCIVGSREEAERIERKWFWVLFRRGFVVSMGGKGRSKKPKKKWNGRLWNPRPKSTNGYVVPRAK